MAGSIEELTTKVEHLFGVGASDNSTMKKPIQWSTPKSILLVIKDVLRQANLGMDSFGKSEHAIADTLLQKNPWEGYASILKQYAPTINKISCELLCKCSGGADHSDSNVDAILKNLSSYPVDTQVLISLAAFAVNYGEFCLITQLSSANGSLAQSISLLKQPDIAGQRRSLEPCINIIKKLVESILKVTDCISECEEFHVTLETLDTAVANTAELIIRSLVACSSQITRLLQMNYGPIMQESGVLSLTRELTEKQNHLRIQIEETRYHNFKLIFETAHEDNIKVLKEMFKDGKAQLVEPSSGSSNRKTVGILELKEKIVVLLVSDLNVVNEELSSLKIMYEEAKTKLSSDFQYEIVWIPVVDMSRPSDKLSQKKFEDKQAMMPWYIVANPWLLNPLFIRYIKAEWHFSKKLILPVLDKNGIVVSNNAFHMFRLWGNDAFPCNPAKVESLCKAQTWGIQILVQSIDQTIVEWSLSGKLICLYGGVDIDWIQDFTAAAKAYAKNAGTTLEMVYVGKNKAPEKRTSKIISTIKEGKLSGYLEEPSKREYFWTRLESMNYCRTHYGKTDQSDRILQEVSGMLNFDGGDRGWVVLGKGPTEIVRATGEEILEIFNRSKGDQGWVGPSLVISEIKERRKDHHCNKFTVPMTSAAITEQRKCMDCNLHMEKLVMYRCCTD